MLHQVSIAETSLQDYLPIVGEETIADIRRRAEPLRGARVVHVNATAFGGGVAEVLNALVPLMNDIGLRAEWRVMYGDERFFNVTKAFHNALQGAAIPVTPQMMSTYTDYARLNAEAFDGQYDFVVLHDPQPAALRRFCRRNGGERWIWRCHIDTSNANLEAWTYLRSFIEEHDAAIFTLPEFVPEGKWEVPRLFFIHPTIDPLSPKNVPLSAEASRATLQRFHIDVSRPLITQISRFDPWKDPLGVIDCYRMVKAVAPEVQLALVGSMATDDPEGWDYYERTLRHAGEDFDIHVLHNLHGVGNMEVNAFQSASDVILQKSLREGFGLTVAEALWKSKPVVAGNVGGIRTQITDGASGYLVEDPLRCAERVYRLLQEPELGRLMGERGREHVRENFVVTRLLRDYLSMFTSLLT